MVEVGPVLTARAAYWYREELRIIGREVMAGANLAIEKWENKKSNQKAKERDEEEKRKWDVDTTKSSRSPNVRPYYRSSVGI